MSKDCKVHETLENIKTQIWEEECEVDNPFAAKSCYCYGYDVYGDILGKASWIEYLFLLFRGERPTVKQASLLEGMAVAIINPGPRDHSIRAAMNGGVGGSNNAASLIAALAVGAGQYGGAHEVANAINCWLNCGTNLDSWQDYFLSLSQEDRADVWLNMEHPPGYDPHSTSCSTPILKTLDYLVEYNSKGTLKWLRENRLTLESFTKCPLAMTGLAAAVLYDLGFNSQQGEMLYLILRLPGAAVHALEQKSYGWRNYPFFRYAIKLDNDPN